MFAEINQALARSCKDLDLAVIAKALLDWWQTPHPDLPQGTDGPDPSPLGLLRIGVPGHKVHIRKLTRVEGEEGTGGAHGNPYGDRDAIGDGLAFKCATKHMQVAVFGCVYVR